MVSIPINTCHSEVYTSAREALTMMCSSLFHEAHVESRDRCIPAARQLKRPRRLESRAQTDIYLAFETITDVRRRNPALQPPRRIRERTLGRARPRLSRPMSWKRLPPPCQCPRWSLTGKLNSGNAARRRFLPQTSAEAIESSLGFRGSRQSPAESARDGGVEIHQACMPNSPRTGYARPDRDAVSGVLLRPWPYLEFQFAQQHGG